MNDDDMQKIDLIFWRRVTDTILTDICHVILATANNE